MRERFGERRPQRRSPRSIKRGRRLEKAARSRPDRGAKPAKPNLPKNGRQARAASREREVSYRIAGPDQSEPTPAQEAAFRSCSITSKRSSTR